MDMLISKSPHKAVAKELRISVNTFKASYREEIQEVKKRGRRLLPKTENKEVLRDLVVEYVDTEQEINSVETAISQRYLIESHSRYNEIGRIAFEALLKRVEEGVKETKTVYEVLDWDENNKPTAQKVLDYSEKVKSCTKADIQLLLELTTDGLAYKDQEMIKIAKERAGMVEAIDVKKEEEIPYSSMPLEDLQTMKEILERNKGK
jgi:hypothetical protein